MLHIPDPGHRVYRISLYNKQVRALVKENRNHWYYDDQWADVQCQDVTAHDENEARTMIVKRFSPEDGFVIESIALNPVSSGPSLP